MGYYSIKGEVKETVGNKTVALSSHAAGAEIIAKALNYYFGDTFTRNQAVEIMNTNTANALKSIAEHVKKHEHDPKEIIDYLLELSDEMAAQALVVSLRDELKFDKPKTSSGLE